jgi:hypothetical protein
MFDQFFHEVYMQTNKRRQANKRPYRTDEYEARAMQAECSAEEKNGGMRLPLKF